MPALQKIRRQRFRLAAVAIVAVVFGLSMFGVWLGSWIGR